MFTASSLEVTVIKGIRWLTAQNHQRAEASSFKEKKAVKLQCVHVCFGRKDERISFLLTSLKRSLVFLSSLDLLSIYVARPDTD